MGTLRLDEEKVKVICPDRWEADSLNGTIGEKTRNLICISRFGNVLRQIKGELSCTVDAPSRMQFQAATMVAAQAQDKSRLEEIQSSL